MQCGQGMLSQVKNSVAMTGSGENMSNGVLYSWTYFEKPGMTKPDNKIELVTEHQNIMFYHKMFNSIWPCLALQVMTEGHHRYSHSGHASLCKRIPSTTPVNTIWPRLTVHAMTENILYRTEKYSIV